MFGVQSLGVQTISIPPGPGDTLTDSRASPQAGCKWAMAKLRQCPQNTGDSGTKLMDFPEDDFILGGLWLGNWNGYWQNSVSNKIPQRPKISSYYVQGQSKYSTLKANRWKISTLSADWKMSSTFACLLTQSRAFYRLILPSTDYKNPVVLVVLLQQMFLGLFPHIMCSWDYFVC